MTKDIGDISAEVEAVGDALTMLSLYFEDEDGPKASNKVICSTLFGFSRTLDRLAEDLSEIEMEVRRAARE